MFGVTLTPADGASSGTVYVSSSTGNDANSGSQASPLATISAAIAAGASEIRLLGGDTFTGAVLLEGSQKLASYGDGWPILSHDSDATLTVIENAIADGIKIVSSDASAVYATVSIAGEATIRNCWSIANSNKALTIGGTGCLIEDSEFDDSSMACAQVVTFFQASNAIFRRNKITRTQSGTEIGLYSHGDGVRGGNVIEKNWITSTQSSDTTGKEVTAIDSLHQGTVTADVYRFNLINGYWEAWAVIVNDSIFYANVIDFSQRIGAASATISIPTNGVNVSLIANTLVTGNSDAANGLVNTLGGGNIVIKNNAVYLNTIARVYQRIDSTATSCDCDYNFYQGSSQTLSRRFSVDGTQVTFAVWRATHLHDENGAEVSMALSDFAGGEYWPTTGSGLIDAATPLDGYGDRLSALSSWPDDVQIVASNNAGAYATGS